MKPLTGTTTDQAPADPAATEAWALEYGDAVLEAEDRAERQRERDG
ncbi:hypothetical protein ABZS86_19395 [Streptomyces sp. NPDC005355]